MKLEFYLFKKMKTIVIETHFPYQKFVKLKQKQKKNSEEEKVRTLANRMFYLENET